MKKFKMPGAWLIDIEGILVKDKSYQPVDGSVEWLESIASSGTPYCLVSNQTTDWPADLQDRLVKSGFPVSDDHLVGVLDLTVNWLRERGKEKLLWLGCGELKGYWANAGFQLVEKGPCDSVVLGANPEMEIDQLDSALPALIDGASDLVCLHRNSFFLNSEGERRLGPGAWAAALETIVSQGKVVTMGKPEERIYREALKRVGVGPSEALFISDDPVADLVTAKSLGMQTVFALSGKYPDHEILGQMDESQWPHIIVKTPADLLAEFQ